MKPLLALAAVAGLSAAILTPISSAVIAERERAELAAIFRDSLERTRTLPLRGRVHVEWLRDRGFEVRFEFEPDGRVTVLSAQGDGKAIPAKHMAGWRRAPVRAWLAGFAHRTDLLLRNYRLTARGTEIVAGRPCRRIDIESPYPGRPRRTVWLDERERIVTAFLSAGESRRMSVRLEAFEITDREGPRPKSDGRRQPVPGYRFEALRVRPDEARNLLGFAALDRPSLPHGFEREDFRAIRADLKDLLGIELLAALSLYTDGIEVLSVLEMKTADYRSLVEKLRVLREMRLDAVLRRISRGQISGGRLRRGALATAERGDTTVVAAGSVPGAEVATVFSAFLEKEP